MASSYTDISKQKPNLNAFIERNNNILNEFLDIYQKADAGPSQNEVMGTSIPFVYNLLGSWLINPSTVSINTFQRISYTDSIISSSLEYNTSIISNTVGEFYHSNKKIEKFVRKCFERLPEGKSGLIRDMLTAMWSGFYAGEKVYSRPSEYMDGKIWIKNVISFPPSTVLFRANRIGELDEYIYQYVYFATNPGIQNSLAYLIPGNALGGGFEGGYPSGSPDGVSFAGDFEYPIRSTNIQTVGLIPVPRTKMIHYVRKGQDGFLNPYGRSMLRSAYNFYILKCAFLQFLAIAGDRKSTPLLVMYVDPNALTTNQGMNAQNPDAVMNNPQATQQAIDSARQALNALRGDSALILPGMKAQMYDVQVADIQGNLDLFINTLKYLDDSMQQSLLIPSSMFGASDGASYALGTTQSSIHNKLLSSIRNSVTKTLLQDYVSDLIKMNFDPEEYNNDLGYFESELLNTEDKINVVKLYETMKNSGLTSTKVTEDINKYRQLVGEKELTDKEMKELQSSIEEANTKDTTNKIDVKSHDKHYKKRNDIPMGGSSS